MHGPAVPSRALPPRLSRRGSVFGVRIGQFVCWQVIVVALAVAVAWRGQQVSLVLAGLALAGCGLTMLRWRRRWGYEWLVTAWRYRDALAGEVPSVCPARLPSGAEAGIAADDSGFSLIVAIAARQAGASTTELPAAALAGLLDQDAIVSAVQLVIQSEPAAEATSLPAAAYRNLGYSQVPRSASSWLVLRHDPARSRYAVGSPGSARDVRASLLRALAGRSTRALDILASASLRGQVLDGPEATELLTRALASPGQAGGWAVWPDDGGQHITYWLRRWPAGGLRALQQALATVPARSVTTTVLLSPAGPGPGRVGLTVTVRVTTSANSGRREVGRAVTAAAASCGARLERLDGEHAFGLLATAPLGRSPAGRWLSWRGGGTHEGTPGTVLPIAGGGVVIGPQVGGAGQGSPVAVSCFAEHDVTRTTVIGEPLLHRLLGLRALGSGARLQVVTSQPDSWLKLRSQAGQGDRMTVVRPGTPPPRDGTRGDPWMIIDDTGAPAVVPGQPWLAVVTALAESGPAEVILPGQDAIVVQRCSREAAASIASSLALPPQAERSLLTVPSGLVAVGRSGAISFARLTPDQAEGSVLARTAGSG